MIKCDVTKCMDQATPDQIHCNHIVATANITRSTTTISTAKSERYNISHTDRLLLPGMHCARQPQRPFGAIQFYTARFFLSSQELPLGKGVAGGHDRSWGPPEPCSQPQTSSLLPPVQGTASLPDSHWQDKHSRCFGSWHCKDIVLCQYDALQPFMGCIVPWVQWVDMSSLSHGLWFSWTLKLAPTWQSQLS